MTGSGPLPGRMGTLTADQELRLKEMWLQILVFGGVAPPNLQSAETAKSLISMEHPSKKKRGFGFHKKKNSVSSGEKNQTTAEEQASHLKHSLGGVSAEEFNRAFRTMLRNDNPDNLLLRFLRARKWDVAKGLAMFGNTIAWRIENDLPKLIERGELLGVEDGDAGLLLQYKDGKSMIHGKDLHSRPIVHVAVHTHKPKAQSEESLQKYTLLVIENTRLCLSGHVDTAAVIFDLSRFSMQNMDYGAVKFMLQCFESHYPESLGFVLIHQAPWIFSGIWNVIKGWIDPDVAAKISFTRNAKDLEKFIAKDQLAKELGGQREWEYKYIAPTAEENMNLKDLDTRKAILKERDGLFDQYMDATLDWIKAPASESAKLQEKKDDLASKLEQNYWDLDPYIRATAICDRDGTFAEFQKDIKKRIGIPVDADSDKSEIFFDAE